MPIVYTHASGGTAGHPPQRDGTQPSQGGGKSHHSGQRHHGEGICQTGSQPQAGAGIPRNIPKAKGNCGKRTGSLGDGTCET